jgi:hypothetical protein
MSPSTTTPALPDTSLTAGRGAAPKRPTVPDVVAGLVNGGSAYAVARAAVEAAVARGARVRFVQVPPPGLDVEERHDADRTTFREALRAMHGLPKVACSFELVDGEPTDVLVRASAHAGLLVVGDDQQGAGHDVAARCILEAGCDVLTVTD